MLGYHKGKFIPVNKITIPCNSPGFQFGNGHFTTLKYINGTFPFLERHIERLENTSIFFGYKLPKIDFPSILNQLIEDNKLYKSRIKIICYVDSTKLPEIVIIPQKLIINKSPRHLLIAPFKRGESPLRKHKTMNYLENIFYNKDAQGKGFDDYLYCSKENIILEASFSNIFFIKDNHIFTPSGCLPLLPGIIRNNLLSLKYENYLLRESRPSLSDLSSYSACFLTNSIHGIVPVKSITYNNIKYEMNIDEVNKFTEENQLSGL